MNSQGARLELSGNPREQYAYHMSIEILLKHRHVWQEKKILQGIYLHWYDQIIARCVASGPTLEIGGGGGNFKKSFPRAISSDYTLCPWLDLNLDGHHLPFGSLSLANIVMIDVLHHLSQPLLFLEEAQRVLQEGGRLIMLEPCISPGSSFVYRFLHQEDVDFGTDLFRGECWMEQKEKKPFDGNMAIPSQLFFRNADKLAARFPDFPVIEKKYSDYLLYPLSGGFEHPSVIPNCCLPVFRIFERILQPLGALLAYRMLVVLQKN